MEAARSLRVQTPWRHVHSAAPHAGIARKWLRSVVTPGGSLLTASTGSQPTEVSRFPLSRAFVGFVTILWIMAVRGGHGEVACSTQIVCHTEIAQAANPGMASLAGAHLASTDLASTDLASKQDAWTPLQGEVGRANQISQREKQHDAIGADAGTAPASGSDAHARAAFDIAMLGTPDTSAAAARLSPDPRGQGKPIEAQDSYVRETVRKFLADADLSAAIHALSQANARGNTLAAGELLLSDLIGWSGGRSAAVQGTAVRAYYVPQPGPQQAPRAERVSGERTLDELSSELRRRLSLTGRPAGYLPANILGLGADFDYVLLVDGSASRLFVISFAGGRPLVEADFFVSMGRDGLNKQREGDMRSPIGIYRIRKTITGSWLPAIYGGFAWDLNYPNSADRRMGRTGSYIWIHGVPPEFTDRMPADTEGCFVLSNKDLDLLRRMIMPKRALVIAVEKTEWIAPDAWEHRRASVLAGGLSSYGNGQWISADQIAARSSRTPPTIIALRDDNYMIYGDPFLSSAITSARPGLSSGTLAQSPAAKRLPGGLDDGDGPMSPARRSLANTAPSGSLAQSGPANVMASADSTGQLTVDPQTARVRTGGATMRVTPTGKVAADIPSGQVLPVLSRQGNYTEVDYHGTLGWVYSPLLDAPAGVAK